TSPEDVDNIVDKALGVDDRPCVIDFRVDQGEMCFPMIPAGASNDDIIVGPNGERPRAANFVEDGSDFAFGGMGRVG
ncbi:MAG: acetolactate synthase large subunit, partial [Actinomycetota bacterium]|nr:acetolactate synthase large subunit [Actinomycetota bacterium]